MLDFIVKNAGTIIVGFIVVMLLVFIIIKLIRDKKKGKCTSCDCCSGACHAPCCKPTQFQK